MGAHSRPKGMHRGETAPLIDLTARKLGATAGVAVVAAGAAVAFAPAAGAATPDDFARLRMCESGGNYSINTGNGYYGAYQFSLQTWRGMGNTGLPSDASPAVQDAQAARLQAARGWQPWPACSRKLGLSSSKVSGASSTHAVVVRSAKKAPKKTVSRFVPTTPPTFDGTTLNAGLITENRADVRAWQAVMRLRGWAIKVDGYFGPQSASVAKRFAAEKGIPSGLPGVVDVTMWNAAWTLPVT